MKMYTFTERQYLARDGRVVPAGHKDARWLLGVPGRQITTAEAERLGLLKKAKAPKAPVAKAPEKTKAPEKAKAEATADEKHETAKRFQCLECGKVLKSNAGLIGHKRYHHPTKDDA